MIAKQKNQSGIPGQIDWIYWLDLANWDNAFVIQNREDKTHNQLERYFKKVYIATGNRLIESEGNFNNESLKNTKFDLIYCTDLFESLWRYPEKIQLLFGRLSAILSNDGKLVLGYFWGYKWVGFIMNKLLTSNISLNDLRAPDNNTFKGMSTEISKFLENNEFSRPCRTLYVYPNYRKPWTISNCELFAAQIHQWQRKTRRNAMLLKFIASKIGTRTLKLWWPYRILVMSKIVNNAQ